MVKSLPFSLPPWNDGSTLLVDRARFPLSVRSFVSRVAEARVLLQRIAGDSAEAVRQSRSTADAAGGS
jgi:hypothetical protein